MEKSVGFWPTADRHAIGALAHFLAYFPATRVAKLYPRC